MGTGYLYGEKKLTLNIIQNLRVFEELIQYKDK